MHKNMIYTVISKYDKFAPFPYPPLYREPDTDYICFTDNRNIKSDYWNIQYVLNTEDFQVESLSLSYQSKHYIAPNQIPVNKIEMPDSLISIPDIYQIIESIPDFEHFIPTANTNGTYHVEPNPEYHNGPYNGYPLLLTIGVPVSNQIATIQRCLNGIKPILDLLPSELLVIDTGSIDGTIEVAKKYNARIINFSWCNNMSAVRNFGIRNAKGAWYMSIDDDEWFESVDDIIDFFQSGKYQNYLFASYIQRNYTTADGKCYDDNPTPRIACITKYLHFEGRIHDAYIGVTKENCYYLRSVANHTGFQRNSIEETIAKVKRNLSSLYYDLYEYPTELRYTYQIANEFNVLASFDYAIAYFIRGLSVNLMQNNVYYQKVLASNLMLSLYYGEKTDLFQYAKNCITSYHYTTQELALIHFMLFDLASILNYEKQVIISETEAYHHYRTKYLENPYQSSIGSIIPINACQNITYIQTYYIDLFCLAVREEDYKEANDRLNDILLHSASNDSRIYFLQWIVYCKNKSIQEKGLIFFEEYLNLLTKKEIVILSTRLCKKLNTINFKTALIQTCINSEFYEKLSVNSYYFLTFISESLLFAMENETDKNYRAAFVYYIQTTVSFAVNYYNPELLRLSSTFLPKHVRAAYHTFKALQCQPSQNIESYVAELNTALHIFPKFKRGISLLLK